MTTVEGNRMEREDDVGGKPPYQLGSIPQDLREGDMQVEIVFGSENNSLAPSELEQRQQARDDSMRIEEEHREELPRLKDVERLRTQSKSTECNASNATWPCNTCAKNS